MINDFINMDAPDYERLYARFLKRPIDDLLLAVGPIEGKRVLDLCAGGLRASVRAKELGAAYVCAVDISSSMLWSPSIENRWKAESLPDVRVVADISKWGRTESFSPYLSNTLFFDLVVCQQGVNYWWGKYAVANIAASMKEDGCFVFNTFVQRPDEVPKRREYEIDGRSYTEVSWLVGDIVVHVQTCEGESHSSTFRWIPHGEFVDVLKMHFSDIETLYDDRCRSIIYVCRKGLTNAGD